MVKKIKKRSKREKAKIKKFRLNLQFSQASLAETEIIYEECLEEYNKKFIRGGTGPEEQEDEKEVESCTTISKDVSPDTKEEDSSHESTNDVEEPESGDLSDIDIKALFRKIAVKTHPDKLRDMEHAQIEHLTDLYKTAVEASRSNDGGTLLELAYELGIDIDIDIDKEILWINEKISTTQQKVSSILRTDAWVWFHSEGERKENIEKIITERLSF
jgi:hypothetical protein